MNSIVMAFSSRLAQRARTARPRPASVAISPAYIQAIGPWESWKLRMNQLRTTMVKMSCSYMQKRATAIKEIAMDVCPKSNSVLLLKQLRKSGATRDMNKLQQPTIYEPTLAENGIDPLFAISANITFEYIIIPSRPVCCQKKQRRKATQVAFLYLRSNIA